ncbi:MAG: DUF192 domain-containing protein [Phenylobacterium sp.]
MDLGRRRALLLGGALALSATAPGRAETRVELDALEIVTSQARHKFKVELADTDEERRRGLMYRKSLGGDRGMLFDFFDEAPRAFWMRNTLIPLDMIFIRANGLIRSIAHEAQPLDETPIPSGGPVRAVLEIAGGRARQLGILPGDRVVHRIFPSG